jgi:carbamate kinase
MSISKAGTSTLKRRRIKMKNEYTIYWVYVKKDDNVFTQDSKPRGKFYVSESGEEVGFQHLWHYFDLHDKDHNVIRSCDLETVCGFDRGPKLRGLVKRMILNGISGKYSK